MSGERASPPKGPWWRQAALLLTVLGLLITLVFNTLAVRKGAQQAKESRESQQIGLLTTLDGQASRAEQALNSLDPKQDPCGPPLDVEGSLSAEEDAALLAALDSYEHLAWLFNKHRLDVDDSKEFFGARMIAGRHLARHYLGLDELSALYPQLTRFYDGYEFDKRDRVCG